MRTPILIAAGLLLVATPALAQHEGHGGNRPEQQRPAQAQRGMQGGGPFAKYLVFAPARLLEHADHLGLSADQRTQLRALSERMRHAEEEAHAPAHAAMQSLRRAMDAAEPDTTSLRQYFQAHQTGMGNVQWIRASAALQARALLTPAQRTMVEEM